ncbi:hypothetical protein [Mycetocola zhadangensis]|uniref:Glycine zipper-like domain-containing protein n=1 Tax=Mycetocola zhadangensis TaxID=1164595 RepID=A0A3L7J107_9MICO|nr:hypothetical protein [Mycetocola zhadangensis]RLQ84188.1 hypothetical protein D9V28_08170 [Mycetocola zhadangensis]GGE95338.1 hypothetical protein GCM10011313_17890 [Mycetocola zhadangensis]
MATDKNSKPSDSAWGGDGGDGKFLAIGIALGLSFGVALSVAMDNWAFLGAGLAIGVAIGVSLDAAQKDKGAAKPGDDSGEAPEVGDAPDAPPRPE